MHIRFDKRAGAIKLPTPRAIGLTMLLASCFIFMSAASAADAFGLQDDKPVSMPRADACGSGITGSRINLGGRALASMNDPAFVANFGTRSTTVPFDLWLVENAFALLPYDRTTGPSKGRPGPNDNWPVGLASMGRIDADGAQPEYSVWRIRNASGERQEVTLTSESTDFSFSATLPAYSEGYVVSPDVSRPGFHHVTWSGGDSRRAANRAPFRIETPIYTGEQLFLLGVDQFIDEFIPFARDQSDLDYLEAWRAGLHEHFLLTSVQGPDAPTVAIGGAGLQQSKAAVDAWMNDLASGALSEEEFALVEAWRTQLQDYLTEQGIRVESAGSGAASARTQAQVVGELKDLLTEFAEHAQELSTTTADDPFGLRQTGLPELPFLICAPQVADAVSKCAPCILSVVIKLLEGDYPGALAAITACVTNPQSGLACLISAYKLARCIQQNAPPVDQGLGSCNSILCPRNCALIDPTAQPGDEQVACCDTDTELTQIGPNTFECRAECEEVVGNGCTGGTLTISYDWSAAAGRDLDSRTALENPAILDDVGWARGSVDASGVLNWTGDVTSQGGSETVRVNVDRLLNNYPNQDEFRIRLRAFWFGERGSGDVNLTLSGCGTLVQTRQNIFVQQSANIDGEDVGFVTLRRDGSFGFEEECN